MDRRGWTAAAVALGLGLAASGIRPLSRTHLGETVLRIERLELLGEDGTVAGWLAVRQGQAELVLVGRDAQASVIAGEGIAALNVVGSRATARLVAAEEGHVVTLPESPSCEAW